MSKIIKIGQLFLNI